MNVPFDPFHKWLGIPPEEQPASYYRLLGIPELESDLEVIEAATEQRTIYLRTFQTGDYSQLAEQLLNMVSSAQVCLLNAETKLRYDTQLRTANEENTAKASPAPLPHPTATPSNQPIIVTTDPTSVDSAQRESGKPSPATRERQRRKQSRAPLLIIGSLGACLILGVVVYMMMEPKPEQPRPVPSPPVVSNNGSRGNNTSVDSERSGKSDAPDNGDTDGNSGTGDDSINPFTDPNSDSSEQILLFDQAWVVVFDAITKRNLDEARQQLELLDQLAQTTELRDKYNRLSLLIRYVEIFEDLWSKSLAKLKAGEVLMLGANEMIAVVEVTPYAKETRFITVKAQGELKTYDMAKMSPGLELAIIETYFQLELPGSLMAAGAHYATRPGTTVADIEKARDYWRRAVKQKPLIGDLSIILVDNDARPSLVKRESRPPIVRPANEKLAIPDKAKTDKHFQDLSDLFKDETANAISPPLKASLATLIFGLTKNTSSTDQLYAILMFSYGLARESGEKPITDKIRGELDSIFLVDVLTMRLEECLAWESLIPKHVLPEDRPQRYHELAKILEEIGTLAEDALNFPVAIQAFDQGFKLNQRSTIQADFSSTLKSHLEKARLAETRYADYRLALEELEQDPDNPDANLKVGTFLAFHQNSWPEALPYLSRGSDPLLRQMAEGEQENPQESSAMESLGDLWQDYAENKALPADQADAYHRTIFWYQQAIANSQSLLDKLALQKKLDNLPQFEVIVPEQGLIFFFPFDGSLQDASPHQHPTRPIQVPKYVLGKHSQAILLDGTSNISVAYHFLFQVDNEFTVSALVILNPKLPSTRSWPQILGQRITSYRSVLDLGTTRPAQGKPLHWRASISNGATNQNDQIGQEIQSTAIVKPGIWTHVVYTVNRNACEFWIDGKLDQRVIRTPETIDNIGRSRRDFTIGSNGYSGSDLNWVGAIDNVRFYDRSLTAREIKSLYQVDAGVAVAVSVDQNSGDDSATELVTNNLSLKFDSPSTRFRVALPDGVSQDNVSLKITNLTGFQETNILPADATVVAGKDVIIELADDPSRVKFRVKLNLVNDEAFVVLRPTFKLVTTSSRDTVLTIDQLNKSIQAIALAISNGTQQRAYWANLLPNIESEVLSLRRRAESGDRNAYVQFGVAVAKYKRASGRIKSLNTSLPKSIRQLERLKGLQNKLNQLQGTAKIYFALVPSSAGN
jgi:hypothetical protein